MNKPDKAGEPSMEEILASIRQIIADEPSTETSEPPIEANPLVPSQSPRPVETRGPLADRLSGVLKNGALPPTDPLGSKRPLSFDQDLADMFDEEPPTNGNSAVAPKPDIRVPTALSHPMSSKSFVPPVAPTAPETEADVAEDERATSASVTDGAAALPQPSPSEAFIPPPPFGGSAEKPADVAPPTTFGFPPLRKTSFYPPQPKAPVTPSPIDPAPPQFAVPAPQSAASPAPTPSDAQDVLKALGGFGSGDSNAEGRASAGPSQPSSEPFETGVPGSQVPPRSEAAETPFSPFDASAPSSSPVFGAPVEPPFGARAYGPASEPPIDATPVAPSEARSREPRSYPDPFAQSVRPGPAYTPPQPRFGTEQPRMSADAAHQALDALAQGLAASAAATSVPSEPVAPAVPLTPVFETLEPQVGVTPPSSTLPATIPSQGSMPVNRTLEDAVADMLRPMLQQWVAENMPRIIERALRTEVAQSVKPGNKPPGT